ncbi:TPA: DUF4852 domain-containing protein, partial [Mannheimia haemolytica]|nr:DUF4852 domain-containing protein [Mannheimia haemolytica]
MCKKAFPLWGLIFGLLLSTSAFSVSKNFNYQNILMESLHFSENIELSSLSKDWLLYSDRNTYHKYQNDEFEFQDKIEQAGKKLQKLVDDRKSEEAPIVFTIPVNSEFGNYDFEQGKFEYQPLMNGHMYISSNQYTENLPRKINLYVSNPEFIDGIPMGKDKAKEFLQKRKNSLGNINRSV